MTARHATREVGSTDLAPDPVDVFARSRPAAAARQDAGKASTTRVAIPTTDAAGDALRDRLRRAGNVFD